MTKKSAVPLGLAFLLGALSMVSPFSIDTFFPSLRAMQAEFDVDALTMQQTLSIYLFPYAVMSLVHGPLSDALGRRIVVFGGTALYTLASIACALAPGFGTLLAFRAMQGMTAGVGVTIGRAVIGDLYQGADAQRLMNAVTVIFSIAPAIAPIIGGWIHVGYGWRGVFWMLTALGLALMLAAHKLLPETHPVEKRIPLQFGPLLRNCIDIGRDGKFLALTLCGAMQFAGVMLFVGSAPVIVLDVWKLTETDFAQLFIPIVGGFMTGALVAGRIAGRVEPLKQLRFGLALPPLAGLCGVLLNHFFDPPRIAHQLLIYLTALGIQFVFPVLTLRAFEMYPTLRGTVSSVQTFVQLALGTVVVGLAAPLLSTHMEWLSLGQLAFGLAAIALAALSHRLGGL
ncbi:MAG: multidrug effflux MFS transporter [Steroidobacteraceae bacterium]|jgi:DHA1 family bicyclomycin/chloramphenicol resistance-like MFS transporter|nr:Bcr/CflA family efflux MFS transporter [Gammaproteobacteria bacterium]